MGRWGHRSIAKLTRRSSEPVFFAPGLFFWFLPSADVMYWYVTIACHVPQTEKLVYNITESPSSPRPTPSLQASTRA